MANTASELKWTNVESSNVHAVAHHEPSNTLAVQFKSGGGLYVYHGVDGDTYSDLLHAPSVGKFLNTQIKLTCGFDRFNSEEELVKFLSSV